MDIRRIITFVFVLAIAALTVGLSGCERIAPMMPDAEMPDAEMPRMMAEGISIGVAVALTGEYAEPYGIPMKRGLDLAREEINMLGDVSLTFVPVDAQSTVEGGLQLSSNWWIKAYPPSSALVSQPISKRLFRLHKRMG